MNERWRHRLTTTFSLVAAAALGLVVLAACTTSDDESDQTPTIRPPTSTATVVAAGPASPTAASATQKLATPAATPVVKSPTPGTPSSDGSSQLTSDGVCRATIPDDWVDDSTGRGTTPSGAQWALFGGRVGSDDDWSQAVALVKSTTGKQPNAKITESETSVRIDLADDRGFKYRGRFETVYCDFTVTGAATVPENERAFWNAIIASLGPVAP